MEHRSMNQILVGFLVAFFSITIVLGSFILTQAESKPHPVLVNSPISLPQSIDVIGTPTPEDFGQPAKSLISPTIIQETPYTSLFVPLAPTSTISFTPTITSTEDKSSHPTSTKGEASCGPPPGWVLYNVKSGDTLYKISQLYRVSIAQLQEANCLGASTLLRGGQQIYVPNVLPLQPSKTVKPTQKPPTSTPPTVPPATESPVVPGTDEPISTETNE
jgi:hypothetical protein